MDETQNTIEKFNKSEIEDPNIYKMAICCHKTI